MLAKLLKYEMKASARTLIPLYIGMIAVAVVTAVQLMLLATDGSKNFEALVMIGAYQKASTVSSICFLLQFAFGVALTVMTGIIVVQRFNKNLIGDEGYLMFTLPVSHSQLILSKLLAALLWMVIDLVVMGLAGIITVLPLATMMGEGVDLMNEFRYLWNYWISGNVPVLGMVAVNMIAGMVATVLMVYTAIMIGQMEQFNQHRVAAAVIAFFGLNWVFNAIAALLGRSGSLMMNMLFGIGMGMSDVNFMHMLGISLLWNILQIAVCFLGTRYLMQKKLNL